jgi:hypothetical protein
MMRDGTLTCTDLEHEPWFRGCCDSCHDDANERNYDMLGHTLPDGRQTYTCCKVWRSLVALTEAAPPSKET